MSEQFVQFLFSSFTSISLSSASQITYLFLLRYHQAQYDTICLFYSPNNVSVKFIKPVKNLIN